MEYSWFLHAFIKFSFSIKGYPAETESHSAQNKQGRNAVVFAKGQSALASAQKWACDPWHVGANRASWK